MKESIRRAQKYISDRRAKIIQHWLVFAETWQIKQKVKKLVAVTANVALTGLVIKYIVDHQDFLAYGLGAATATYYISWLIKEIRGKPPEITVQGYPPGAN